MKRILILTASFGEGHNSAARAVKDALDAREGVTTLIADLYALSIPKSNIAIQHLYTLAINHFPRIWQGVFVALDRPGLMESMLWTGAPMAKAMDRTIAEFRPDAIISTYPLYPYLYRKLQRSRLGLKAPFYTVVTDSVGVNSAWHRCLSDGFFLADQETADLLAERGVPKDILHPLGFPVAKGYAAAAALQIPLPPPWKLLFMPSTQLNRTLDQIRSLLTIPDVKLTVLAGKHIRIFDAVNASGLMDGERCQLVGWTDAMPRLVSEHHVFIGKAGGAIVQEALTAQCPFIVSHLVPGQEEGNIALIERLDVGVRAYESTGQLLSAVENMMANHGKQWSGWKANLAAQSNPGASDRIANLVLGQ
jgi:processive 1,2-diacylglycerol beta-glucosyltransferase